MISANTSATASRAIRDRSKALPGRLQLAGQLGDIGLQLLHHG
ncbi:hypothetical protein [Streptomyces sp. 303MFCol5.2]|nr:hypothetical protein [Streptomyces sp. 303MFCol5.2]